jgi:polyhydroxybutyrate depolymerase
MKNTTKPVKLALLFTFITTLLSACGGDSSEDSAAIKTQQCFGIELNEQTSCLNLIERKAIVYKKNNEPKEGVALFLHGAPGSPDKVMGIFDAQMVASKHNLVAVSPEGITEDWGWLSLNSGSTESNADIDYLTELISKVRAEHNVTSDKLYIFGYSAGGFMAYTLACEIPEQITAMVSLAGQFRGDLSTCDNNTPVSIHHLHSTTDKEVSFTGRSYGKLKSVGDTIELWRDKNGCDNEMSTLEQISVTATHEKTQTMVYNNCLNSLALSEMPAVPHEANYVGENLYQIYKYLFDSE